MLNQKIVLFLLYHFLKEIIMQFDQFLGYLIFMAIFTMGFWLMIFVLSFVVPIWVAGGIKEMFTGKKKTKKAKN